MAYSEVRINDLWTSPCAYYVIRFITHFFCFPGIKSADGKAKSGLLEWSDNWVSFMDTMLQFSILGKDVRELYLPTRLQRAVIDPKKHLEFVEKYGENGEYTHTNCSARSCFRAEVYVYIVSVSQVSQYTCTTKKIFSRAAVSRCAV